MPANVNTISLGHLVSLPLHKRCSLLAVVSLLCLHSLSRIQVLPLFTSKRPLLSILQQQQSL